MSERRIKCALLTAPASLYDAELTLACAGLELVALAPSTVRLPVRQTAKRQDPLGNSNPLGLPEDDRAEAVLIESHWYRLVAERYPERIDEVMRSLERRANLLVGLDADQFALGFPPSALERLALVIKFDGLYRDRDLYNYFVGCRYPGANWTEKLRPRPSPYRASDLDKLRLSVPCFMRELPAIRRAARARLSRAAVANGEPISTAQRLGRDLAEALLVRAFGLASGRGRPLEVHCVVAPTHPQRVDAMRLLEGFSGKRGVLVRGVRDVQDAAPEATGGAGGEDDDTFNSEHDHGPHYYREWIEAWSPPLASAKLEEWRALLAAAKPFGGDVSVSGRRERHLLPSRLLRSALLRRGAVPRRWRPAADCAGREANLYGLGGALARAPVPRHRGAYP
jgi:hypothetical protein